MKKSYLYIFIILFIPLMISCAGAGDYKIELPNHYVLTRSSAHEVSITKSLSTIFIPPKVVALNWNENYIVAMQLGLKKRNPNNPSDNYKIPDESKEYYWIIDIKKESAFGPLSKDEFEKKKAELSISVLKLKEVNPDMKK